jgi:cell division protein ZapA
MKQPVEVEIMGQRLTVTSEDSEEHVRHIAGYVDEQMRQAAAGPVKGSTLHLALVVALNIASEYWKLHHQQKEIDQTINRMAQRVLAGLEH